MVALAPGLEIEGLAVLLETTGTIALDPGFVARSGPAGILEIEHRSSGAPKTVCGNIEERLEFSCAVFDANTGLVANAPHIPVHLGAMEETVCELRNAVLRSGERAVERGGHATVDLEAGDELLIETPGSGSLGTR